MLVISRRKSQKIMIGDDIEIMVVDVVGDKVRLGITAPREIPVDRPDAISHARREHEENRDVRPE